MVTSFECPSCGAALEPPTTSVTSVKCHYCGTTVAVPDELRIHPAPTPHQPESFTINIGSPQDGTGRSQVTFNVPADDLVKLEQLEQAEVAMQASRRVRRSARGCGGCGCLLALGCTVGFAGFMIFIFGFSIKSSVMYSCALQMARRNADVIKLIGTPIKADTFAWIDNYESSGSSETGRFNTQLSGPKGSGTLNVDGSHNSRSTRLDVTFETGNKTIQVSSGSAACE